MLNVGWFSTGRGEGSQGLLRFVQERIGGRRLDARISFVFSNREWGEAEGSDAFFRLAAGLGIPCISRSSAAFRRAHRGTGLSWSELRPAYDRQVLEALAQAPGPPPDICVLAGYMLIVSGKLCRRFPLLNLHPALPDGPIGAWQDVIWTLIERRASRTGAMLHLAAEAVDRGPVVSYCTAGITGPAFDAGWQEVAQYGAAALREARGEELPLFRRIRQAEYCREPYLLLETLRALAEGRVVLRQGEPQHSDGRPLSENTPPGLCLDAEIDRAMAADGVP